MAERRMLSQKIVDADAFLDMPPSSQNLYFHLCIRADDDGFVGNPKKIMRMVNASEDEYKLLVAKRFILTFQSGICVIKHWLIHNLIRADLYKETQYKKEKKTLGLNENRGYTEMKEGASEIKSIEAPEWFKKRRKDEEEEEKKELRTACVPLAYRLRTACVPLTVPRLDKNRLDKNSTTVADAPTISKFIKPTVQEVANYVQEKKYNVDANKFWNFYESKGWKVGKTSMKNWHACIANWVKDEPKKPYEAPRKLYIAPKAEELTKEEITKQKERMEIIRNQVMQIGKYNARVI